jgi:hypothetical protein
MRRGRGHRYGAVLLVTLGAVTFALAAPDGRAAHATELVASGVALLVAMLTSGARPIVSRREALAATIALGAAAAAVATGAPPAVLTFSATAAASVATIVVIVRGLVQMIVEDGVGVQAVFGALAVYLLLGLTFAFVIGAVAVGFNGDYFAQGTDGTQAQRVYYSYTVLTTTGFGDLTARTPPGRAVAVLEMLIGQLYLVTVIATLVGNLRGRRRT